jgi:sulfur carrier protein ThiS
LKLNVKLYGTLSRPFEPYDHQGGLVVTLPGESRVRDLLVHLNLSTEGLGMIFMDKRPAKEDSLLEEGMQIKIFQPIFGG